MLPFSRSGRACVCERGQMERSVCVAGGQRTARSRLHDSAGANQCVCQHQCFFFFFVCVCL